METRTSIATSFSLGQCSFVLRWVYVSGWYVPRLCAVSSWGDYSTGEGWHLLALWRLCW
jgi:hypothetical protein